MEELSLRRRQGNQSVRQAVSAAVPEALMEELGLGKANQSVLMVQASQAVSAAATVPEALMKELGLGQAMVAQPARSPAVYGVSPQFVAKALVSVEVADRHHHHHREVTYRRPIARHANCHNSHHRVDQQP